MQKTGWGDPYTDAEALFEKINGASDAEVEAVARRRKILHDALHGFNGKLCNLPARQRDAALSLLYNKFTDMVFDFHLAIEENVAREKIAKAATREEKLEVLREFRSFTDGLALLYGVSS